ncbi:ATP-grasp domain-containing protein [Bacillus thuringiensis]|uniref:ATP-grasp domain-containing protein n=1 Tax=Bacillus thuringiensis TaxID=1428 RepID=UPI000BEE2910|nr:ATP-grasp domain-containing protein [Bacillus thuringiensis]PEA58403.1 phosphoribosylglycinamide synthetase [Bacillus thuringiensis]PEW28240.1 phosphoribosylglycinamide synthetase [Bacillus thuringiensis]
MKNTKIGIIMRKGYSIHGDHIETAGRISDELYLFTSAPSKTIDARFKEVIVLEDASEIEAENYIFTKGKDIGISFFVTWQETDIVLTAKINERFGNKALSVEAATTSRDKSKQREFMLKNSIASPKFAKINSIEDAEKEIENIPFPVIIKPTMAASSESVYLVNSLEELNNSLEKIINLSKTNKGFYFNQTQQCVALVEEFLTGEEITVDGVVLNGEFYLGGIHNKNKMMGPYFEEDEYTLPYIGVDEDIVVNIAKEICEKLSIENSLFNVELRRDTQGNFKVVEFSTRISGGHVYRNIRDVHGIDLVAVNILGLLDCKGDIVEFFLTRSTTPKSCTCIKFVYRSGIIKKNELGIVAEQPEYKAYYPVAKVGSEVYHAPKGFDITGLLSLRAPYRDKSDVEKLRERARELDNQLDIELEIPVHA